jgi:hypothetical protein
MPAFYAIIVYGLVQNGHLEMVDVQMPYATLERACDAAKTLPADLPFKIGAWPDLDTNIADKCK